MNKIKLNKENYKQIMSKFISLKGLNVDKTYIAALFSLIKDDVTDDQFGNACKQLVFLSNEDYFEKYKGKAPSVGDWLRLCDVTPEEDQTKSNMLDKFTSRCWNFIDCVHHSDLRKELEKDLTDNEKRALKSIDIGALREGFRRQGQYKKSEEVINNTLSKAFNDYYKPERNVLAIEDKQTNNQDQLTKVNDLISKSIKKG